MAEKTTSVDNAQEKDELVLEDNQLVCALTNKVVKATDKELTLQSMIDMMAEEYGGKSSVRCPLKPKRFYPLKIFNNAPSKSLDRWGYYYFSLFPSVCRHLPDTFSV